jgi:hypothetical protein
MGFDFGQPVRKWKRKLRSTEVDTYYGDLYMIMTSWCASNDSRWNFKELWAMPLGSIMINNSIKTLSAAASVSVETE